MSREYLCRYCMGIFYSIHGLEDHLNSSSCREAYQYHLKPGDRHERRPRGSTNSHVSERRRHPDGEDEVAADGEHTCVICMMNKSRIVNTECGHQCCCIMCSHVLYNQKGKCPMCRGPWNSLCRVHYS